MVSLMRDSHIRETTQVILFFFFFTPVNNKNLFQGDLLHEPFKRLAYIFLIRVPQVSNYLEVEK